MNIQNNALITLVHTLSYTRAIEKIWDSDMQAEFENFLGQNFQFGDIIPGTGGIRKIRWGRDGIGKRAGTRIIYYFYDLEHPLYLLFAYPKNAQENISDEEKKAMSKITEKIKKNIKRL